MKKFTLASLLTLTAAAASAQTTLYGQVGVFGDSTKTGAATARTMQENRSRIGLSVQEKILPALSVSAVVETSLAADNPTAGGATQLGDRQSTVGLSTKMVSVDLGRRFHSHYLNVSSGDPFSAFYFASGSDIHAARGFRLGEAVMVQVRPMKNVTLAAERTMTGGTEATVLGASTSLMGVGVGLTHFKQGAEESTGLSLKRSFGNVTLSYTGSDDKGVVTSRGHSVGASMPVGPVQVSAFYGRTNTDVSAWNLGVDYNLSKRTSLHAAYRDVDRAGTGADVKQYVAGVIHRF